MLTNEITETQKKSLKFTLRIILSFNVALICQLKNNVDRCRRVDGLSISHRRFEFDLLSGAQRIFIKSMPQSADNIENAHFACGGEQNVYENFAFQLQLSCFVGVVGFWLE